MNIEHNVFAEVTTIKNFLTKMNKQFDVPTALMQV